MQKHSVTHIGTALAATLFGLSGQAQATAKDNTPAPTAKPHVRFIVMDKRFDIADSNARNTIIDACTALGKVNLVANQSRARETVEQVVDCFYFKPAPKKPQLMHIQFYQMLTSKPAPATDGLAALSIKAGFVPVREMLDYSRTATRGTFLLSDKPLQPTKAMAPTILMGKADCGEHGCNTHATIADLGAFFAAGGIDTAKASAWQMVMPPQHYVLPPEQVTGLLPSAPQLQPYRAGLRRVSYTR